MVVTEDLTSAQQKRMCELCELHILGCSSNSLTFLCEGSRCDEAIELLQAEIDDNKELYKIW